jgi:hypothetical protein
MKIAAEIEWRKDGFGHDAQALYLGNLCAGHIMFWSKRPDAKWRGWFMNDDEGGATGWFETAELARASVEKALFDAIQIQA